MHEHLGIQGCEPRKGRQHQLPIPTNTALPAPSKILKCNPLQSHQITACALKWFKGAINDFSWSYLCPHNGPAPGRADLIGFVHLAAEALSTRTTFLTALHGFHTHRDGELRKWGLQPAKTQELSSASPIRPAETSKCL